MNSAELIGRGWLLLLAFTVAVLTVAALRRPCRRLFGTERAFQLWLLPPLAMLASQLPHATMTRDAVLPSLVYMITSAAGALPSPSGSSAHQDWRGVAMLVWGAGVVTTLLLACVAQRRYRRRLIGARPLAAMSSRWPVWQAASADIGPALVGAWHCRIVLPADFESRYDATEQALILAHETAHARRRDGWWCLFAQFAAAVFWFHPLAWWGLAALRHDQELACDAVVLAEHDQQWRNYANAMLKTQSAEFALPVGCPWSPRHPLTERIAMFKQSRLQVFSRRVSGLLLASLVAGGASMVYAAGAPLVPAAVDHASAKTQEYQLDMYLQIGTRDAQRTHTERMTLSLCTAPGKVASISTGPDWQVEATVTPEAASQLGIDLAVFGKEHQRIGQERLQGAFGDALMAEGKSKDGKRQYAVTVTPLPGCPSRTTAAAVPEAKVSERLKQVSARVAAEAIASKAGLVLINPESMSDAAVTFDFQDIPADRAMQLLADIAGMKVVIVGKDVRFEPK